MLLIRIARRQDDLLVIDISKHATKQNNSNEYSLICAGVSAISIGLCNAIYMMAGEEACDIDVLSDADDEEALNHITIKVVNNNSRLQDILKVGLIQLQCVAEHNENYIDLKITEV